MEFKFESIEQMDTFVRYFYKDKLNKLFSEEVLNKELDKVIAEKTATNTSGV